ncbi:hypothetical protein A5761_00695 [Mycolicibacterium setense]|uniref:hypothetical protein n=1 Tax=Mycolicibacterium setense TaxID=431269 RepID=UPI0003A1E532|nr:hypothetical protein [Mycolicibacterium setense]OBB19698.1 hypothetical protein A5761_00695 [Mycolicibacterium setense]
MAAYERENDGPVAGKRRVRSRTDRYIPYGHLTDDQRAAREVPRAKVRCLAAERGEILYASFAGFTPDRADSENLVLYNIDETARGCFQPGTPSTESALKRQMHCTAMLHLADHMRTRTSMP